VFWYFNLMDWMKEPLKITEFWDLLQKRKLNKDRL